MFRGRPERREATRMRTIKVTLPVELVERLTQAAYNRRDVFTPTLTAARDILVERAVQDMLAGYLNPVARSGVSR